MGKILITEQQLERLSKKLIKEQQYIGATVSPIELVETYMTHDLNKILLDNEETIVSQYLIGLGNPNKGEITLLWNKGKQSANFNKRKEYGQTNYYLPINKFEIKVPEVDMDFVELLENSQPYGKDYKAFFEVNDAVTDFVKRELQNVIPTWYMYNSNRGVDNDIFAGFKVLRINKKLKNSINIGEPFPITEVTPFGNTGNNLVNIKLAKGVYATMQGSALAKQLQKIKLTIPSRLLPKKPPEKIVPKTLNFNTKENFDFNQATLRQEAKDEILAKIITPILSMSETNRNKYIAKLEKSSITLSAFASRDDDPEKEDYNDDPGTKSKLYSNCSEKNTRGEYNRCLSQARAQAVVNYLQTEYEEIFGNVTFTPKGGGENINSGNQWVPGTTDHDSSKTQSDRNFVINLPSLTIVGND